MNDRLALVMTAAGVAAALAAGVCGCGRNVDRGGGDEEVVLEGVLFSVEYYMGDGRTGGFTRSDKAEAVPGGNGSWNVNARGQLTRDYLLITYPGRTDIGPRVIPARRLVDVQFGDGGIETDSDEQANGDSRQSPL